MKEFKTRNIKFHTYKSKQEGSYKVVLKHMPPEEKIDELGLKVTNIWKKHGTKMPLNMFYVEAEKQKKQ